MDQPVSSPNSTSLFITLNEDGSAKCHSSSGLVPQSLAAYWPLSEVANVRNLARDMLAHDFSAVTVMVQPTGDAPVIVVNEKLSNDNGADPDHDRPGIASGMGG